MCYTRMGFRAHNLLEMRTMSSVDRSRAGPAPAQDAIVNVFVEIPVGGGVRYRSARGISEPFEGVDVVPALADVAYGFVVDTYNAADGDAADAYVIGACGVTAGTTTRARVVGIRRRNNGDHKLVTVRGDRREFHDLCEISDLPTPLLDRLGRWDEPVERPGETWG